MWEKLCLELSGCRSRRRWKRGGKREKGRRVGKEKQRGEVECKVLPFQKKKKKKAMVSRKIGCAGWAEKKYVSW